MSNLLLLVSVILNIFLTIYIFSLKKYIENIIKINEETHNDAIYIAEMNLNKSITKLSDNMDRHFAGMAGKVHLLSNVLQTGEKGTKK